MSTYICNDATLNRILAYLGVAAAKGSIHHDIRAVLNDHAAVTGGVTAIATIKGRQALGDRLRAVNTAAFNQRYNRQDVPLPFVHKPMSCATTIQTYKHVECLSYQCVEGDIPDKPEYKFLIELENTLIRDIVHRLDDYQDATWGE